MKLRRRRRVKRFRRNARSFKWVWASARKRGAGPRPAQSIWQGSGFAADQTNAMLATSNGGDKSSRKRKPLHLLGITAYAEKFSICGREMKCFFIRFSRGYFPCTQCFFGTSMWGWYHYPRRALHAVETLDARGSRRRIRRLYAAAVLALCGLKIPAAGTHATQAPNRTHSGSQGETRGVFTARDIGRVDRVSSSGTLCIVTFGTAQFNEPLSVAAAHHGGNADFT